MPPKKRQKTVSWRCPGELSQMIHTKYRELIQKAIQLPGIRAELMSNGVTPLSLWPLKFTRGKTQHGVCSFGPVDRTTKQPRCGSIGLSLYMIKKYDESKSGEEKQRIMHHINDTLAHEISHALAGPRHGHDEVWKSWARKMGAEPKARTNEQTGAPRRVWQCKANGKTCWSVTLYSKPRNIYKCPRCQGTIVGIPETCEDSNSGKVRGKANRAGGGGDGGSSTPNDNANRAGGDSSITDNTNTGGSSSAMTNGRRGSKRPGLSTNDVGPRLKSSKNS